MYAKRELTIIDYIVLSGAIVGTLFTLVATTITAGLRGQDGAKKYRDHVMFSVLRKATALTARRGLITPFTPTTSEVYSTFMKEKGLEPHVVSFADTVGCWMGDSNADIVVIWFHGGGYTLMAAKGLLDLLWDIVLEGGAAGKSVAVFLPQYDIAPQAVYPQQLIQGAAAVRKILTEMKRSPSQVILGGDSAGGNLALGVMSHIMHPDPSIPVDLVMDSKFKGIVLVSPWVTFDQTSAAFKSNKNKDSVSGPALKIFSEHFMGNARRNEYNHPLDADPAWWKNLPAESILLLGGKDELFIDDIVAFGDKIKIHNGTRIEELFVENECHDQPLVDYLMGGERGVQTRRLLQWTVEKA